MTENFRKIKFTTLEYFPIRKYSLYRISQISTYVFCTDFFLEKTKIIINLAATVEIINFLETSS